MKKKLLIISRFHKLIAKGYSITLQEIYKTGILQEKYEIHQLAWHKTDGDELIDGVYVYGVEDLDRLAPSKLKEILGFLKPDIIFLHADPTFFMGYIDVLDKWKGDIVAWFTIDSERCPSNYKTLFSLFSRVITTSNFGKTVIQKNLNISSNIVLLGVNHDIFKPMTKDLKLEKKKELGLKESDVLVLVIGVNILRKAHELALEAFNILLNEHPEIDNLYLYLHTDLNLSMLEFINTNPILKKKVLYTRNYDFISSPYPVEKIVDLYNSSDILFSSSYGEGFGMPFLEAGACKVLSLAPNNSSITEVVGDGGVLYPSFGKIPFIDMHGLINWLRLPDIDSAVKELYELYLNQDKREVLAEKAYKQSLERTWEKTTLELRNIFDNVLENSSKAPEFIYTEPILIKV